MPLFLILILVSLYNGVGTSTLDIHYVCLGFAFWMNLEVDLDACLLWTVVLSCCDCVEVRVRRGTVPFPQQDSNPRLIAVALMA
jgi:hypothetical protein